MIYHSLDDIYALLAREHTAFAAATAGLNEAQTQFRPAADAWTIAEIVEHIAITNSGFVRIGYKLINQAEAAGAPPLAGLDLKHVLLTDDGQPLPRFKAPDSVTPKGGQSLADSGAKIEQAHADIQGARARFAASDCSQQTFPHPAVGQLNPYQWLLVYGEHMERHRGQIERIKAAADFPF
ncbi:MAG: DinB family protein [Acidobacteria bacterium]|nr:DinB family protein [Acidobacteriota bacterium]MBI3423693.1 DinB family protein [Acidobacteriota bacterium]